MCARFIREWRKSRGYPKIRSRLFVRVGIWSKPLENVAHGKRRRAVRLISRATYGNLAKNSGLAGWHSR